MDQNRDSPGPVGPTTNPYSTLMPKLAYT